MGLRLDYSDFDISNCATMEENDRRQMDGISGQEHDQPRLRQSVAIGGENAQSRGLAYPDIGKPFTLLSLFFSHGSV
jgi:hypothetical protein